MPANEWSPAGPPSAATVKSTVISAVQNQLASHSRDLLAMLPNAALGVISRAGSLIFIVLVPILSFFFMKNGQEIRSSVLGILSEGARPRWWHLAGLPLGQAYEAPKGLTTGGDRFRLRGLRKIAHS